MKEAVMKHFKEKWQYYAGVLAIIFMIGSAFGICFRVWNMELDVPLSYAGGDEMSMLVNAKMFESQGWVLDCDRLGAPYGANFTDFTANMLHNAGLIVLKIFVMISGNAAVGMNLTFISIFIMAGLVSYYVMLRLNIRNWISVVMSAVFGFSPFMIMRSLGHIVLTECYFIPLSILLCIWLYERDDVLRFDKTFFKKKDNYLAIIFCLLIANNGIAYYPFFTCFLLIVTGLSRAIKEKKFRYIGYAFKYIIGICVFVGMAILPHFIYVIGHGSNVDAVVRTGGFAESEMYAVKIIQLFLPVDGHNIPLLEKVIDSYNTNSIFVNENITSYIGLVGIIGFVILLVSFFMKKQDELSKRLGLLSEMNIMMLLLAMSGGFGTIFAFVVTDKIRGYNRLSIIITYVCVLAAALLLNKLYTWLKEQETVKNAKAKRYALIAVSCVFCYGAMYEGFPRGYIPDYEGNKYNYESDDAFVKEIEAVVSEEAMIYQLPDHYYPEGGSVNEMGDYDLFVGFIHSDKLRWSYGSVKGREGSKWSEKTSEMSCKNMIAELKEKGFEGIYIDRRAYEDDELKSLENELSQLLGKQPVISENGNLSFFAL